MTKLLIIAEHLDGQLNAATAKTVSAALALSPEAIDIAVLAAIPTASPRKPNTLPVSHAYSPLPTLPTSTRLHKY